MNGSDTTSGLDENRGSCRASVTMNGFEDPIACVQNEMSRAVCEAVRPRLALNH
jgi:hypothetical protein